MEDAGFVAAVVLLAIGGPLGVAYSLDMRRRKHGPLGLRLSRPGPAGTALWTIARGLTLLMLLLVSGALVLGSAALAWATLAVVGMFFLVHTAYRIVRLTGR
jgi:hypothetical protein